jgi:hypothetical protein
LYRTIVGGRTAGVEKREHPLEMSAIGYHVRAQGFDIGAGRQLTRTFAAQMEALMRYRTGGEQKVMVQHVTVSDGGQAIVGNVTHGSREPGANKSAASQPLLADAKTAPMPIIDGQKRARVPAVKKNEE